MLLVPHHGDIRVNTREHLPAPFTHAAGADAVRHALQRRCGIAGRRQTVAAAGKEQRMGQISPGGGLPDANGGGICRRQVKGVHLVSPLGCLPSHFTIFRWKKEGGIPRAVLHETVKLSFSFQLSFVELPQFFGHFVLFSPVFLMPFMHCFLDFQLL